MRGVSHALDATALSSWTCVDVVEVRRVAQIGCESRSRHEYRSTGIQRWVRQSIASLNVSKGTGRWRLCDDGGHVVVASWRSMLLLRPQSTTSSPLSQMLSLNVSLDMVRIFMETEVMPDIERFTRCSGA